MSSAITAAPPADQKYSFKKGDTHVGVWAIQRALNGIDLSGYPYVLTEDGGFGLETEKCVLAYQRATKLTADGIFGPASQARLVRSLEVRTPSHVPVGLIRSVVEGESGNLIACVNWDVPNGVDCGYTQRRVSSTNTPSSWPTGATFKQTEVEAAFDSFKQFSILASGLRSRKDNYVNRAGVINRADKHEYAWRLATLYHNWPYGANRLADGYALSNRVADWVPAGVKFTDGTPVVTYTDWAQFYALGSPAHSHKGLMVKYVSDWIV